MANNIDDLGRFTVMHWIAGGPTGKVAAVQYISIRDFLERGFHDIDYALNLDEEALFEHVSHSFVFKGEHSRPRIRVIAPNASVKVSNAERKLRECDFVCLSRVFDVIMLRVPRAGDDLLGPFSRVASYTIALTDGWSIEYEVAVNAAAWNKRWTYNEVRQAMVDVAPRHISLYEQRTQAPEPIRLRLTYASREATLREVLEQAAADVDELWASTHGRVDAQHPLEALERTFVFHPAIKRTCEQYLSYFGQFLADLGIEAETSIKESAGKVLFTVSPVDGQSALSAIHDALEIYLRLPEEPLFQEEAKQQRDVAVTQLSAQVLQLQHNYLLIKEAYELQAERVALKDERLKTQQALIGMIALSNVKLVEMQEGRSRPTATVLKEVDEEEISEFVTVQDVALKGTGIKVKLPRILRALKRKFP